MHAGGGFLGDSVDLVQHGWEALMNHQSEITTIVKDHVGIPGLAVLENGLLDTPIELFLRFAFPSEDRNPLGCDGSGCMVLGREDIAR